MQELNDLLKILKDKLQSRSKSSSGVITINIDLWSNPELPISIEFGGYDFNGLPRHYEVGEFATLEEGLKELKDIIVETPTLED